MGKIRSIIISGDQAQDHEFIYPYYRMLEEDYNVDVCIIGGKPVKGILGTTLPPNKDHPVKDINQIKPEDYELSNVKELKIKTSDGVDLLACVLLGLS